MFKAAGSVLNRFPQRNKAGGAIVAMQVRQIARAVIDDKLSEFGQEAAKEVLVKSYKFGVLTITAPPTVLSVLFANQARILEEINENLKISLVKKILMRTPSSR